jgi:MFS transporter, UMF1 family
MVMLLSRLNRYRPIVGWLLYDIASSGYILLIPSVAYAVYYRQAVCGGADSCDGQWAMLTALGLAIAGGLAPLLGAIADLGNLRHRLFAIATLICCLATTLLFWVEPGAMVFGGLAFVLAQVGYSVAMGLYDAYLPGLVTQQRLGQLSGLGWGLGYLGGLACFMIARPWLQGGLTAENLSTYRLTFPLVAGFYGLVAWPALAWLPRPSAPPEDRPTGPLIQAAYRRVFYTLTHWRQTTAITQFLAGYYLISAGVVTVVGFTAIYLNTQFGLPMGQILSLTLLCNAIAIPATLGVGWLSHGRSAPTLLKLVLLVWVVTLLVLGLGTHPLTPLLSVICLGLVVGSTQALCRGLFAAMVPPSQAAELFGFHAMVSKVSAIFGPLLFGVLSTTTGNQRLAMLATIPFFVVGGWVLLGVSGVEPSLQREEG